MTDNTYWGQLLSAVHTSDRKSMTPKCFTYTSKIVSLSFIHADAYFINEYGEVWNKTKLSLNRSGKLTDKYLPIVHRDVEGKYPWVLLTVAGEKQWFPLNLLLGWAFFPQPDKTKRYFNFKNNVFALGLNSANDGTWSDTPDDSSVNYRTLINEMYR